MGGEQASMIAEKKKAGKGTKKKRKEGKKWKERGKKKKKEKNSHHRCRNFRYAQIEPRFCDCVSRVTHNFLF